MFAVKTCSRFAALTALVCAFALAGCGKKNEPTKAEGDPKGGPPPGQPGTQPAPSAPVDLAKATPEATYTIQAFIAEMRKNSNFPISKHAGKVIDMTGVVTGYGFGPNEGAFMLEMDPMRPLESRPYKVGGRPWTKGLPKQTVTLRTQVAASTVVPESPWVFVEAKGSPLPTQTAEQLVKERNADSKAFDKKYEYGRVMVTGDVAGVKKSDGGGTEFQLAAGGKEQLVCTIPGPGNGAAPLTASQQTALKPGTKVKLLGRPTGDWLTDCIVLDPAPDRSPRPADKETPMFAVKTCSRFAALTAFVCALALAGCGKKDEPTKAEGDPKTAEPKAKKEDGDITIDDLRAATKAAGGDPDKPEPPPKPLKPPESLKDVKPDVVIPTRMWHDETKKDSNYVFKNYPGQVIEVSGVVSDYLGKGVFVLGEEGQTTSGVLCSVFNDKPWTKVLPSQVVTLRARVVTPFAWEIVDAKGPLPFTLTAEQIVREDVTEKLRSGWVVVTGVIGKADHEENGDVVVYLAAGEKETLRCVFHGLRDTLPPEQKKLLKTAQKVKFLGRYVLGYMASCIVLEPAP